MMCGLAQKPWYRSSTLVYYFFYTFKILNLIDIKVMHVINILVKSKELMSKSKTIFSMFDILAECCRLYIDDGML